MKTFLLVLKIGALLAVIFATGVWVGRNTAPSGAMDATSDPPGAVPQNGPQTGRWAFAFRRYVKALDLTPEQQARLEPLFREADNKLSGISRLSIERQQVIEELHQQMEPHLSPQQQAEAVKIQQQGIELLEKARNKQ